MSSGAGAVTELLKAWRQGSAEAGERLIAAINDDLRRIAAGYLRREQRKITLEPGVLVNEAYMRLVGQDLDWQDRGHFFAIASREMRRVLVEHARKRHAAKRDGLGDKRISVSELADDAHSPDAEILSLHDALSHLATIEPRQAEVVELKYFGGLTADEIARHLSISVRTVKRELTDARLWLRQELRPEGPHKGNAT